MSKLCSLVWCVCDVITLCSPSQLPTLTGCPVALSFGVSNGHTETEFVTVTLTGPFDDSGKVTTVHEWRVVQCMFSQPGVAHRGAMFLMIMMSSAH